MELDSIDQQLLSILQKDCKQTNKALAISLGLSVTAVFERIRKLEKNGIIKRYVALLDQEKINKNFVAFCHVKLVQHSQEFVVRFEKQVANLEEVLECYHISGDYDYILKVLVADMSEFRSFMVEKLTKIDHIGSTHSMFMINEVKHSTDIPIG
jgi:Lrp/AsnC family leucine-responsive transcriptional regulator